MGGSGKLSLRTGVFLQARLGSTRLPGKALMKLEGKTLITHAMESLNRVEVDVKVLLTDHESYKKLAPYAEESSFDIFAGSAEDVLDRFLSAAVEYDVDTIIRATGDNPLVDAEAASLILENHIKNTADYSAYDLMPLGTGVEILQRKALERAAAESEDPYDHEHVSPYLYRNPDRFSINRIDAPAELAFPNARVTVDTDEDFRYLQRLFRALYGNEPLGIKKIIPWLSENRRSV